MNNLNVCSAHSYLYHRSQFKLYIYIEYVNTSPQIRIILSHIQCVYMYCQKIIFAESIISSRTLTLMLALTLTITLLLSYSHGNEMKGYVSCKLIITISNFRGPQKQILPDFLINSNNHDYYALLTSKTTILLSGVTSHYVMDL